MKKQSTPKPSHSIVVEIDGTTYAGTYTYAGRVAKVSSEYGDDNIEARPGQEEYWARFKLRELVRGWLANVRR